MSATVSKAEIKRAACWDARKLTPALAAWPSDPVPWSWFLGARLNGMTRADALLRVQVAISALHRAKVQLPQRAHIRVWFAQAPMPLWAQGVAALVAYAEAADDATRESTRAALHALLEQAVPATKADPAEIVQL